MGPTRAMCSSGSGGMTISQIKPRALLIAFLLMQIAANAQNGGSSRQRQSQTQTLSMQSQNHDGLLFDNLFIDSFGWGGDPNNALHARFNKNKWYDFNGQFRRDQTDFDYNLLANPLNPPTSTPSIPVTFSPHSFYTRRRMSDFDLTLLP